MLKTPPLQTATATIETLCGRLQSATLLEDRRAAILGLRSFAKQYPASVASGSLRELIATLKRDGVAEAANGKSQDAETRRSQDGGDVDTIRLILETLLMLFNPDSNSPEAGDEIAFFMADEFSMRQDNFLLLLSLLDPASPYADYYSRLYSVQILSAICAARPERLQECIISAPLGISRLVGVLDDPRDAVRNAGLLLLVDLTSGANEDLRKIVAFEDVFGKIFALINLEGGIAEAGITAQDCLTLLANLITGSASNQTMFRESGCVPQLKQLLDQGVPPELPDASFLAQSREKATWGLLQLLRLFLVQGESSTAANQNAFFRAGTAQLLINLAFLTKLPVPVRVSAMRAAAALVASNAPLQEQFAALQVMVPSEVDMSTLQPSGHLHVNGDRSRPVSAKTSARPSVELKQTYIIEALLETCLDRSQTDAALREAACELIQAYLVNHNKIKAHFLQRAVAGHSEHEKAANVLTTLLQGPDNDALRITYASRIVQDLISSDLEAKQALAAIKEGNESEGEDVITFIQALGAQLQSVLQQQPLDERPVAAYASMLTIFLWDFAVGVDHLLADGSSLVQALLLPVKTPTDALVAGLSATLLGTVYEFSAKDSPIPRRTLAPILRQKLGRAKYLDALLQLRRQPGVRDFELATDDDNEQSLLSKVYIDLFTLEYARLRHAIDKDPGIEVLPSSSIEAGVDRDILDQLRAQLQTAQDALTQSQQATLAATQATEQTRLTTTKDLATHRTEIDRLKKIHESDLTKLTTTHQSTLAKLTASHQAELSKLSATHDTNIRTLTATHESTRSSTAATHARAIADLKGELERKHAAALRDQVASAAQKAQEYERRLVEAGNTLRTESAAHGKVRGELEGLSGRYEAVVKSEKEARGKVEKLELVKVGMERDLVGVREKGEKAEAEVEGLRKRIEERDGEVERLEVVVKELREEVDGREEELKTERTGFAELEKELEGIREEARGLKERVAKVEKEAEEAKEGEKAAKEELESLLLVMNDIEAKRDAYKAKVKELGGEISDDEEDEDEDDENDGEDGEDGEEEDDDVD